MDDHFESAFAGTVAKLVRRSPDLTRPP